MWKALVVVSPTWGYPGDPALALTMVSFVTLGVHRGQVPHPYAETPSPTCPED